MSKIGAWAIAVGAIAAVGSGSVFEGWGVSVQIFPDKCGGHTVVDIFATFSLPTVVVNCFSMKIVAPATLVHDDAARGSWHPNHFSSEVGNPSLDSFVTIGGAPGLLSAPTNSTMLDPSFQGSKTTVTGGWFNSSPPNLQGATQQGNGGFAHATWIGRFVFADVIPFAELYVSGSATTSQGTFSGTGVFGVGPLACLAGCCPCLGDLDDNGLVDGTDLGLLLTQWGTKGSGDLNGDGIVDGGDLGILLANWGLCVE